MRPIVKLLVLLLALPAAGCASLGETDVVASPDSAGIAALDGGLIGQSADSKTLPRQARMKALDAEFQALQFTPAGEPVDWADGAFSGEVVPTQLYRVGSQDCRGYTHTFTAKAGAIRTAGTACRTANGLWKPVA